MDSSGWLIIAIVILTLCSGFFSATETAFSSFNKIKIKNLANEGSKRAKRTLILSENYDKLLTSILIGNNIVNIASASLATVLFTGLLKSNADLAVTVSTIVMTVITLIFGEISPKSIAKESAEGFAMAVSGVMYVICVILTPFNWIFSQWKKLLLLIFKPKKDQGISEAELITIVDEATNDGDIDKEEGELIRSAIEFNDLTVKDIYTPRVDVIAAPLTSTKEELRLLFVNNGFSRLPIYDNDIDHIIGILHEKDFYYTYFEEKTDIKSVMTDAVCVTLSSDVSTVLKLLQKSKTHMAVVIDEYGGTAGVVTLEDILEELVGEIWDEHDEITEDIVEVGVNEYIVNGNCSIEDLFEKFNLKYDEDELDVTTVSGWVIENMGKMPDIGDEFTYENLIAKITSIDNRRVEKISLKVIISEDKAAGNEKFLDKLFTKSNDDSDNDKE